MTATVTSAFRDALAEHLGALRARDLARFAATFGDDVAVVDGAGRMTRGSDAVLRAHAEWFDSPNPWQFEYKLVFTRETPCSGFALIEVTYREREEAEPARFLLSLLFERQATGAFAFVYDQNTPLK